MDEPLVATLLFAAVFLFGHHVHLARSSRTAVSAGAGVSIAYVFVHLLPELNEAGRVFVEASEHRGLPLPELRIYVAALLGFVAFYGLEHMVQWSRGRVGTGASEHGHEAWIFFVHVGGFALYGALVSYLLVREITNTLSSITLYAVAMGLHFLGVDHALQREHTIDYLNKGRFILAGAVVAGWMVATLVEIPQAILISGLGLVSGGVVMNSMIMELPGDKDGRFLPFVLGAAGYTLVLVLGR